MVPGMVPCVVVQPDSSGAVPNSLAVSTVRRSRHLNNANRLGHARIAHVSTRPACVRRMDKSAELVASETNHFVRCCRSTTAALHNVKSSRQRLSHRDQSSSNDAKSSCVSYNSDVNNFVELRIRRKHTRALVDTGAYYNCLNLSFANRMKIKYFPLSPDKPETLVSTNDGKLKVHGMTTVCVSIGGYVCDVDFLVVDDLNVNCILGLSMLKANQADVKLSDSIVTLQNGLTAVPLITRLSKSNILRWLQFMPLPLNRFVKYNFQCE